MEEKEAGGRANAERRAKKRKKKRATQRKKKHAKEGADADAGGGDEDGADGADDGDDHGATDNADDGANDGANDGTNEGANDGDAKGADDGADDGEGDGTKDAANDGAANAGAPAEFDIGYVVVYAHDHQRGASSRNKEFEKLQTVITHIGYHDQFMRTKLKPRRTVKYVWVASHSNYIDVEDFRRGWVVVKRERRVANE